MAAPLRNVCSSAISFVDLTVFSGLKPKTTYIVKVLNNNNLVQAAKLNKCSAFSLISLRSLTNFSKNSRLRPGSRFGTFSHKLRKLGWAAGLLGLGGCGYMLYQLSSRDVLAKEALEMKIPMYEPSRKVSDKAN